VRKGKGEGTISRNTEERGKKRKRASEAFRRQSAAEGGGKVEKEGGCEEEGPAIVVW